MFGNSMKKTMFVAAAVLVAHQAAFTCASAHSPQTKKNQPEQKMPAQYQRGLVQSAKTGMGVRIFYEFASTAVDKAGLLTLKISRLGGGVPATLELRADASVELTSGLPSTPASFNAGDEYVVKVKPSPQGLHYINVFVQSGNATEAMAIPVQLGQETRLMKPGHVATTQGGKKVISMPAQ
jgi:hypothetical protein